MSTFTPLRDIVLVERIPPEKTTSTGIIHSLHVQTEMVNKATVIAVGPGFIAESNGVFIPSTVKVGDTVIIPPGSGHPIEIPGIEGALYIIREVEIAGVIS
jgi:co-chaperonin GroES (HSP10)